MASDKVNYPEVGIIAQAIKASIRDGAHWEGMDGSAKESLDQIATSIARMVSGDGTHWDAIIGYAHAAKPDAPAAMSQSTLEIERGMRALVRDLPARNHAT